jgi:CRISPR-associated endonuclease Cas1
MIIRNPCSITKEKDKIKISQVVLPSKKREIKTYYPSDIDCLFLYKHSSLSIDVLQLVKFPIYIIDKNEISHIIHTAKFIPKTLIYGQSILKLDKKKKRKLALTFCRGVCYGRIKVLVRLNETRKDLFIREQISKMQDLVIKLKDQKDIEQIKAIEGNIAGLFFSVIQKEYPSFSKRDKDSQDPFNILLNFTHSLLRSKTYYHLIKNNINPYFGFLHFQQDKYKPFLSWDFAELWIAYCDKLCLYMLQKGIIKEIDFKDGYIKKESREEIINFINKRISDKEINDKVIQFKDFIISGRKFNWK